MKTQKRFVITGMFKRHTILGICLILAALFACTAHAQETIGVDPGPVGEPAFDFAFNVSVAATNSIKLEFFDNKTLKAGPGITGFMFTGITDKGIPYSGVLLDANGEEIPGTEFDGVTSFDGAEIDFQEATVWSSILFKDGAFLLGPHWLFWVAGNPVVGEPDGGLEPVTIGGNVSGLVEGGVLVLQNNGADDLEITEDGPFTFATTLTPGDSYNVTVFTQPEGQTCSVENGTGEVPEVPVTDVAVTCTEVGPQGNFDDTWYRGSIKNKYHQGWLTGDSGDLVKVKASLNYYFRVCDDEKRTSDCDGVEYHVVLAIADFDGDGIFEADEVFNIFLKTCGLGETSFVAEVDVTDGHFVVTDPNDQPLTFEVFNQATNGRVKGEGGNKMRSRGCGWTSDSAATDLDPDITGRKCRFNADPIPIDELPFTAEDLLANGVIADVDDLNCNSQ